MTHKYLPSEQRAVSNMVSVVILTGVVLIGLGTIGALGYSQLDQAQNDYSSEEIGNQFEKLSGGLSDITDSPREATRVFVDFGEQGSVSVKNDTANLQMKIVEAPELKRYENPVPDGNCGIPASPGIYGDTSKPNQPVYSCDGSVTSQANNVSASVTIANVERRGPSCPPRCDADGPPNQIEVDYTVTTDTPSGIKEAELILYDADTGAVLDTKAGIGSGSGTHQFTDSSSAETYRVAIVARDNDGVANGQIDSQSTNAGVTLVPGSPVIEGNVKELTNRDIGEITYNSVGQPSQIAYQGGGVFKKRASGSASLLSSPPIELRRTNQQIDGNPRPETLVVPITDVVEGDNPAVSSSAYLTELDSSPQDHYPDRYVEADDVFRLELTTEYADGWRQYFNSNFDDDQVTLSGRGDTVIADFGGDVELYVHARTSTVQVSG